MQGLAIIIAILAFTLVALIIFFLTYVVPKTREEERGKLMYIINRLDKPTEINVDSRAFWDKIDKHLLKISINSRNTDQARTLQQSAEEQKRQVEELNRRLQEENDNLLEAVTTLSEWQKDFRSISYHAEQLMFYLGPYAQHFSDIVNAPDED